MWVYVGGVARDGKTPEDTRTSWQKRAMERYVKDFHRSIPRCENRGAQRTGGESLSEFRRAGVAEVDRHPSIGGEGDMEFSEILNLVLGGGLLAALVGIVTLPCHGAEGGS